MAILRREAGHSPYAKGIAGLVGGEALNLLASWAASEKIADYASPLKQ